MKLLAMIALFITSSAFAQLRCLDKLLPAGRPSAAHQLLASEWLPPDNVTLDSALASKALSSLVFGKLLCREGEVEFDRTPICLAIDESHPENVTCSCNSNIGYFIVTTDTASNANVIFHRAPRQPGLTLR